LGILDIETTFNGCCLYIGVTSFSDKIRFHRNFNLENDKIVYPAKLEPMHIAVVPLT
jgi:hypothetical protein